MQNTLDPLRPVERDTIPKIFFGGIDRYGGPQAMLYRAAGGSGRRCRTRRWRRA